MITSDEKIAIDKINETTRLNGNKDNLKFLTEISSLFFGRKSNMKQTAAVQIAVGRLKNLQN